MFVNLHYLPIHLQPFYRKFGFKKNQFPTAEEYAETAISIPIYPNLKRKEQIILMINEILTGEASFYQKDIFLLTLADRNKRRKGALCQIDLFHSNR